MSSQFIAMFGIGLLIICNCACTQRPKLRSQAGFEQNGNGVIVNNDDSKQSGPGLSLDNTKLALVGGPLTAKINLNGQALAKDFTPVGARSVLNISGLTAVPSGMLTVEIYQGQALKFIIKKSRVALLKPASDSIVVDDCSILSAPWDGKNNDGSCEWTITEVAN